MGVKSKPKVNIILINYNGDNDTVACVNSLRELNYENFEIVVVDNASRTQEELEKRLHNSVVYLKSAENLGFSGGNNIGIRYAIEHGADYVLLLNNDTVVESNFVEKLVDAAGRHRDAGILTGKIVYYSKPDYIWYAGGYMNLDRARIHHYHIKEKDFKDTTEKTVTFATGCLMMIPRSIIEKYGGLDDTFFMYSEDAEFCSRIMENGYKIWYIPTAKIYHKVSASSGGAGSKLSQYYRTRNEMYLVARCANHKIFGCCCCMLRLIKRIIVGQFEIKNVCYGLADLITGRMGKTNRNLR